jgi:hypothetical protein
MNKKILTLFCLSGLINFSYANTGVFNYKKIENPTQFCAQNFNIKKCDNDSCAPSNEVMTSAYLQCTSGFNELTEAMKRAPIGLKSFELNPGAKSYQAFEYKYYSLFMMPLAVKTSYEDMKASQALVDKSYTEFNKNNIVLKNAYMAFNPFDTKAKKDEYAFHVNKQKELADNLEKMRNAVNFMLYNKDFYNLFLTTYQKFYPLSEKVTNVFGKELTLYECQFFNITENFLKIQKELNFTCSNK